MINCDVKRDERCATCYDFNCMVNKDFFSLIVDSKFKSYNWKFNFLGFDNGIRYLEVFGPPRFVLSSRYSDEDRDFLLIYYTKSPMIWKNGKRKGELGLNGGLVIFDCNDNLEFEILEEGEAKAILLPYSLIKDSDTLFRIKCLNSHKLSDAIGYEYISNFYVSDCDIIDKITVFLDYLNSLVLDNFSVGMSTRDAVMFERIKLCIYENIRNPKLRVHDIARNLNLSPRSIQRILSLYGTRYQDIVKETRLELLSEGIISYPHKYINEVCYASGYNSVINASVQFKAKFGMTISDYRKKILYRENLNAYRME